MNAVSPVHVKMEDATIILGASDVTVEGVLRTKLKERTAKVCMNKRLFWVLREDKAIS